MGPVESDGVTVSELHDLFGKRVQFRWRLRCGLTVRAYLAGMAVSDDGSGVVDLQSASVDGEVPLSEIVEVFR